MKGLDSFQKYFGPTAYLPLLFTELHILLRGTEGWLITPTNGLLNGCYVKHSGMC